MMCNIFFMFIFLLFIFFGMVSLWFFGPFKNYAVFFLLLLNFKSSLYILGNSALSDVYFANILSQSVTSHSFGIVFCRVEVFNFSKFCLSILSFMDHAFATVSKKASSYSRSYRFSHMLCSRN